MENVNNKIAVAYYSGICGGSPEDSALEESEIKWLKRCCGDEEDAFVFKDIGEDTSLKRKGLQKLLKMVEEDKIKGIVVTTIDRFTSNANDWFKLKKIFDKHNVQIETMTKEELDSKEWVLDYYSFWYPTKIKLVEIKKLLDEVIKNL